MLSGATATAFATPIAGFMGVEAAFLTLVGVAVIGFGLVTMSIARPSSPSPKLARLITLADVLWVVGAAVLIFGFPGDMTGGGRALLFSVSVPVGIFAVLQSRGVRLVEGPKRLVTEVKIDATPEVVWDVLTDLDSYEKWNPHIREGSGTPEVGRTLELLMDVSEERQVTMRPTVTAASPGRAFEWLGHLGVRGVFDGRHRFELEPLNGGTRMIHSEEFTGILVPVLSRMLDDKTLEGFQAMNAAIKERVESPDRPGG